MSYGDDQRDDQDARPDDESAQELAVDESGAGAAGAHSGDGQEAIESNSESNTDLNTESDAQADTASDAEADPQSDAGAAGIEPTGGASDAEPPRTGDPVIDAALVAAAAVRDAAPAEQLEAYVGTHRSLQDRLADSGA